MVSHTWIFAAATREYIVLCVCRTRTALALQVVFLFAPVHLLHRAVMSYLQVVGEQHQLVEHHMASFTARLTDLQDRHGLQLGSLEVRAAKRLQRTIYTKPAVHEIWNPV